MQVRISGTLSALMFCAAMCFPAAAASRPMSLPGGSLWAGGNAYVAMALGGPAAACRLVAFAPGTAPVTLSTFRPTRPKIAWAWKVPSGARSATWRVSATCGSSRISILLTVHGSRNGVLSLAHQVRVLEYSGRLPSELRARPGAEQARTWWSHTATKILAAFHSGAAAGQCTDYVARRRPDIIARVDIWAYSSYLRTHKGRIIYWTAENWTADAERAGLPTGHTPRPGAVVVFQPGAYGAWAAGHVAYVDEVGRDGSFTISEMHAPLIGRVSTRSFDAATARAMRSDPNVRFIYK